MASQHMPYRAGDGAPHARTAPEIAVRLVGALLALAVSAVHAAEQGGVTALASPDWIGWGYRLIEAGGVLTLARRLGWAAGVLLGTGPFLAYIASRTVGMPGDPRDAGNWDHWLGTVSLLVEGALVALSVSMLLTLRRSGRQQATRSGRRRHAEVTRPSERSRRKARASYSPATPRSLSSTTPPPRCPTRPARCNRRSGGTANRGWRPLRWRRR